MTMGILKKWATDTLKNSAEFQTLCTTVLGEQLNYYRSAPVDSTEHEVLPYLTVYSDEHEVDDTSQEFWNETFNLPLSIGITTETADGDEKDAVNDAGVTVWETTDDAELLASTAKTILKTKANGCGIGGEDIRLIRSRLYVSEIGEADDVQASMLLTFAKANSI